MLKFCVWSMLKVVPVMLKVMPVMFPAQFFKWNGPYLIFEFEEFPFLSFHPLFHPEIAESLAVYVVLPPFFSSLVLWVLGFTFVHQTKVLVNGAIKQMCFLV